MPPVSLLRESDLRTSTLDNGIKLYFYRYRKLPIVQCNLLLRAGASIDPVSEAGTVNLLSEMIDEGSESRSALEIAEEFEFLGAQCTAWTTPDTTGLSLSSLEQHLDSSLDLFAEVILHPRFPGNELSRIKHNVLTTLTQERDQPNVVASRNFTNLVYGKDHPYGASIRGTEQSVASITREMILQGYEAVYSPENAVLIVVANLEPEVVEEKLERRFGGWYRKRNGIRPIPPVSPLVSPGVFIIDKPGAVQSQIRIGHPGIHRTHPDYFPVMVMNQVLGGQFTSRINLNLREDKGYTYGASTIWETRRYGGHFMTTGSFQGEYTEKAVAELLKEITQVKESGVTTEENRAAKDGLIRALPRQFETPLLIANQIGSLAAYELPDDFFVTYLEEIDSVNDEAVDRAARTHLYPESSLIVIVGDAAGIKEPLAQLGVGSIAVIEPY